MKRKIIPLLISCFVIIISGCKKNCFVSTYDNPVSATINGVNYKSRPEQMPIFYVGRAPYRLDQYSWGFTLEFSRELYSDQGSEIYLALNMSGKGNLELNKRYPLPSKYDDNYDGLPVRPIYISEYKEEGLSIHHLVSGWIEFCAIEDNGFISGSFEMDLGDSSMEVRNGQFGPVLTCGNIFNNPGKQRNDSN